MERVINYGKLLPQSAGANAQQKWCFNSPVRQILVAMSQQTGCSNHTPSPPSHPSRIRTHSRSNPTFFSVLLFKLLQAVNSTPSNLWQLFTFPSGKLVGEGTARGRILGAKRVNGGGEYRPRKCPTDWMPRKASVCGAASVSPSHYFIPGLPVVRAEPQNSRLCSLLPSAPPTHSLGFSLPH